MIVPPRSPHAPDPGPDGWIDFLRWLLGSPERAAFGLAYLVVVLGGLVALAWVTDPSAAELGALLGGGIVVCGPRPPRGLNPPDN